MTPHTADGAAPDDQPTTGAGDSTRLSLPPVDTSMRLYRHYTVKEAKFFVPGLAVAFGAALAGLTIGPAVGVLGMLVAVLLLTVGGLGYVADRWWTSAPDRVRNTARWLARRRTFPWTTAADDTVIHGIATITESGTVVRADDTRVALVRIHGTNTAMQLPDEDDALAAALGSALDEDIKDIDVDFYATTRDPPVDDLVAPYQDRLHNGLPDDARTYLEDVVEWTAGDSQQWVAHDWRHYAVVRAYPEEGVITRSLRARLRGLLPGGDDGPDADYDERMASIVAEKADRVATAINGVDGLDAERAGASETVAVLANYWRGRGRGYDTQADGGEDAEGAEGAGGSPATNGHAAQALAPDIVTQANRRLTVEDDHVRTIWIAEWPPDPAPMFLRDLYTARGVDLDVCLSLRARDKHDTVQWLNEQTARVDAETMEREEAGDIQALDSDADIDYYLAMRRALQDSSAQAWDLSGYVTVRAADRDALAHAEQVVEQYDALHLAKDAALADACESATRLLESAPANCLPVQSRTKQLEAFRSCAPTHPDEFADVAAADIRTTVLGGLVGGAFPFCATTPQEPAGLDLGRNTQTMQQMRVDPFERGSGPHCLTLGKTRSGKTFAVSRAVMRWYLQNDDHHLVVCDTQQGFHGLTRLLGGEHVVVDATSSINPLHIAAPARAQRSLVGGQADPYRLKIEEATQWVLGILRAQGVPDPGEYAAVIEHGIEETYRRAGITQADLQTLERPSPTLSHFFDVLGDMVDDPGDFTFTGHDAELAAKRERAVDLLERLSGFHEGGKYHDMLGASGGGLLAEGTDMAYLDLQQLQGAVDAEKSVMLHLMLSQVSQFIKRVDGPTIFAIDEAHMLLHSEEMVAWLQKAAREWARYDAALWFISQSPQEFVQQRGDKAAGEENHRQTIVDQCSMTQVFFTELSEGEPGESDALRQLGMNRRQDEFVQEHAARGMNNDHSEALVNLVDYRGWFPTRVEASPFEQYVLEYAPHEGDGAFDEYFKRRGV